MRDRTMDDDKFYRPLHRALRKTLSDDAALAVLHDIPNGWAKVNGRWVRLVEVEFNVYGDHYDATDPPSTRVLPLTDLVPLYRVDRGAGDRRD